MYYIICMSYPRVIIIFYRGLEYGGIFQSVFRSGPSGSNEPSRCMCECENRGKIWLYHRAFVYNVYINYFFFFVRVLRRRSSTVIPHHFHCEFDRTQFFTIVVVSPQFVFFSLRFVTPTGRTTFVDRLPVRLSDFGRRHPSALQIPDFRYFLCLSPCPTAANETCRYDILCTI